MAITPYLMKSKLEVKNDSSDAYKTTIQNATLTGNRTLTLPNADATLASANNDNNFSALQTFTAGIAITGGTVGNGKITYASNVLYFGNTASSLSDGAAWIWGKRDAGGTPKNYNAAKHLINGSIFGDVQATVSDQSGLWAVGTNCRVANTTALNGRTDATTSGGAIAFQNAAADASAVITFCCNQAADSTSTTADEVGFVFGNGAWTFPMQPFARGVKTADVTGFTSGNTVQVYLPQVSDVGGDNYAPGTADHESGSTTGSKYTVPVTGVYLISARVCIARATGGQFLTNAKASIEISGTETCVALASYDVASTTSATIEITSGPVAISATSVIKFFINATTTGGAWDILAAGSFAGTTTFSVIKLA